MIPATTPPLVTDTTSTKQAERARRKTRDRLRSTAALLKHQLGSYEGRQFVWWLIEQTGVFEDVVGSDASVREQIGRQRIGRMLLAETGRFDELFNQMFVEGRQRATLEKREAEAARLEQQQEQKDTTT